MHYKKQELHTLRGHRGLPLVFGGFVLLILVVFCIVLHFALFVLVLYLECPMLQLSLDCPFLIAPSVYFIMY